MNRIPFTSLLLILLMALAASIRVAGTNDYYYNSDEAMHLWIASSDSLQQLIHAARHEIHPPLMYMMLHYWLKISDNMAFVRCLSLMFGVAVIPVYYLIGKKINGELTGLFCAILVVFSDGLMVQSCLVRNYAVLVFLLSSAFYFYLKFTEKNACHALAYYFLTAFAACLTHFSALFFIFIIALSHSTGSLFRKSPLRVKALWITANLSLAAIAFMLLANWNLSPVGVYSKGWADIIHPDRITWLTTLFYFPIVATYILPGFVFILLLAIIPFFIRDYRRIHHPYLKLALMMLGLSLTVGMLMNLAKLYPLDGLPRRNLWNAPFIILFAGIMLAEMVKKCTAGYAFTGINTLSALFLTFLGYMLYDPAHRFSNSWEYMLPLQEWKAMSAYLETVNARSIIVSSRDDGMILTNIYRYLDTSSTEITTKPVYFPWRNTNILLSSTSRITDGKAMIDSLTQAEQQGYLANKDTIIFMTGRWNINQQYPDALFYLITCPQIHKQIITFPVTTNENTLAAGNLKNRDAVFAAITKEDVLRDLISPDGKARACLESAND